MAKEIQDVLRIEGVKARGFGVFPKIVALDSKMSIYSKAVYAYFCSLAGKGETVFPLRDTILRQLRIGRDAYYAALHELIDQGFIIIEQEESPQGSSQFRRNVYTIVARPQKYTDVTDLDEKTAKRYAEVARYGLDVHGYGLTLPTAKAGGFLGQ